MKRRETAGMLTGLFVITNLLGLFTALQLRTVAAVQQTAAQHQAAGSAFYFFAMIGIATVLLLLLYRFNAGLLVKLWFGSAILLTSLIFFSAHVPPLPAIILTATVLIGRYLTTDPIMRNLFDAISFAGAGALFGSILGIAPAFVLLLLLSGYDYVSVRMTKHMVSLAKSGTATDTFMGFTYPKGNAAPEVDLDAVDHDIAGPDVADTKPTDREGVPVGILGGGDVIIPMIFALTLLSISLWAALAAMAGAAAALYLLLSRSSAAKFYPAIPFLTVGLLTGVIGWQAVATVVSLL